MYCVVVVVSFGSPIACLPAGAERPILTNLTLQTKLRNKTWLDVDPIVLRLLNKFSIVSYAKETIRGLDIFPWFIVCGLHDNTSPSDV